MKALVIFFLLVSFSIFAQEKKQTVENLDTSFKFHSQIFFNYSYSEDMQGFNNANNRFYFGFKKNINKMISTRFTLDVGRDDTNRYTAFMKYGYVKMQFNKELSLTMGIFLNPIHGFSNKFWGHRYITSAYGGGYWNAVPQGIILDYVMGKLLKVSLTFTNGSGYKFVGDNDKNKNIDLVIISSPVKGLDIALQATYVFPIHDNADSDLHGTAFIGYSMKMFKLGYQLLFKSFKADGKDANGDEFDSVISMGHVVYLRIMPLEYIEVFGSFLMNDPNTDSELDKDAQYKAIGGVEYKMSEDLKFAVSYETKWTDEEDANGDTADKEYVIWFSSYVNF